MQGYDVQNSSSRHRNRTQGKAPPHRGLASVLSLSPSDIERHGTHIAKVHYEAFSIAERMKARSFLDELGAAKFARAGVSGGLLEQKRMLEARMKWLKERQ
jgi:hypothetical protein